MPDFKILTRGMPARTDEWLLAMNTPLAELPKLTEEEKRSAARSFRTDEQYARHLLLRSSAKKRESEEAEQIGAIIESFFAEIGDEFQLNGVVKRGFEPGWRAQIQSKSGAAGWKFYEVQIPTEDFSGEPGKQALKIAEPEQIRDLLIAELGIAELRKVAI